MPGPGTSPIVRSGYLTPTPQRQAAFVGFAFGGGIMAGLLRRPTIALRTYGMISSRVAAAGEMAKVYPALGPDRKVAVEFGFSGDTVTLAQAMPFLIAIYGNSPVMGLPVPDVGFGLTSVANSSSRLAWENNKKSVSRGGQDTSRTGKPSKVGSSTSPLTPKSGTSSKSGRRKPSQRRRGPKGRRSRGNSRRPTPWCRRHNRRHFCKYTRKR